MKRIGITSQMLYCLMCFFVSAHAYSDIGNKSTRSLQIMSYNVENLFDTNHDTGKEDYTFLPIGFPGKSEHCAMQFIPYYKKECYETDWIPSKLKIKLNQIKKVVLAEGVLPDILALQEIENSSVVRELANLLGYESFQVTNSPDKRGIDVALLFKKDKLTLKEFEEIVLNDSLFANGPTRNILRVHFSVLGTKDSSVLGVYVNHWPSQGSTKEKRVAAAKALRESIEYYQDQLGQKYHAIALGDFNTLPGETPNAISDVLGENAWSDGLIDIQELAFEKHPQLKGKMPPASYYYKSKKRWQRFDRILMTQNLLTSQSIKAKLDSFQIFVKKFMTVNSKAVSGDHVTGIPLRYNHNATNEAGAGYSDHFPVKILLEVN